MHNLNLTLKHVEPWKERCHLIQNLMKWEPFMSENKAASGENNMAKVMDAWASYSLFAYQFTYSKLEKLGMDFQNKFQNLYYKFDGRFIYLFLLYFFQIHKYISQKTRGAPRLEDFKICEDFFIWWNFQLTKFIPPKTKGSN